MYYLTAAFSVVVLFEATLAASKYDSRSFLAEDQNFSWATLITLKNALTYGESLKGKEIEDLRTGSYNREASGGVFNFLKWTASVKGTEIRWGRINVLLRSVTAGFVEGFASHKASDTATGTQVHYSMMVDDDILLHFMYDVPYDFTWNKNKMAVAVCSKNNQQCANLNADKMYDNSYPFMKKKDFYHDAYPMGICFDDVCVMAWMLQNHKPSIFVMLLPRNYYDLDEKVRQKTPGVSAEDYDSFIEQIFR